MLPVSPLQRVPGRVLGIPAHVELYLKREDQLSFGGGNKVRRLLHWKTMHPHLQRVGVLSDRGSHTFYCLSRMAEQFAYITLYERACEATPYRETLREVYQSTPGVQVIEGSLPLLWLRSQQEGECLLGIGGALPECADAYRAPMEECLDQLAYEGKNHLLTWHVFPIASGTMADGFLQVFRERGLHNHRICGVLTGHTLSKPWLHWRYRMQLNVCLWRTSPLSWVGYRDLAREMHESTGLWVDPNHGIYSWSILPELCASMTRENVLIYWVTSPDLTGLASRLGAS